MRAVRPNLAPAPPLRDRNGAPPVFLQRPRSFLSDDRIRLLDVERSIASPSPWEAPGVSRLWSYHLHYFDGLLDPATPNGLKHRLVESWIEVHRPGARPGWEAYPLSRRIVNWIKWLSSEVEPPTSALDSLAAQTRYLERTLEYHLLGNHLLANAKALVFSGLFFRGPEADRWLRRGWSIFEQQITEQFFDDGGHFERSPMYHAILTEDLLDLRSLSDRSDGVPVPSWLQGRVSAALRWAAVMSWPDGRAPLFNDAADGVAPTWPELRSFADALGVTLSEPATGGPLFLPDSGYLRFDASAYLAFVDAGPPGPEYLAAHAHCGALSFQLWSHERRRPLVVDTGTSTYEPDGRRLRERSTAAHNTVQLGDREQSEIWAAFRMGGRARLSDVRVTGDGLEASVTHWSGGVHERRYRFLPDGVEIEDRVRGNDDEPAVARIHLHPDERPRCDGSEVRLEGGGSFTFGGAESIHVVPYEHAPRFNVRCPASALQVAFRGRLTTRLRLQAASEP